ncbi:acyl-CoA thioester hydrolase/BAAT C-terminal domain-containing protein [Pantoea sp. 18069]|uniref:acyl-CoA thioester hydrolase/BAAT C-terminal domain-containing protein n=1 Tax=Pantoea sp. 18069 TaxID=2681415 RepID=UPI00135A9419|nr:acyl-CoA thioester hydrolase/BAAT C-terminal domain-containing protein [Pantoea sp. 18069]
MHPQLEITPQTALIDVPRSITLRGLTPGQQVTLRTRTVRGPQVEWTSEARFLAGADGCVDLTRDAPESGSYSGVSAMGLIWSQTQAIAGQPNDQFAAEPSAALTTEVRALVGDDGPEFIGHFVQQLAAEGVTRREIRDEGLSATLFTPATPGPHPVVMVLNGSGGGINEPRAALYASRGYAALAVGYFKSPGRSDYISDTQLEYFETALQWIHRELQPKDGFVALSGQSRGGELVLLLGSLFPDMVKAVIGYVPSALVHCAQNACDPAKGREGPAWIFRGKPLADIWSNNRTASWAPWDEGPEPRRHTAAMLTALQDADAVERARIRVERIAGPVMLLSATDDGSWPSSLYGKMVKDHLAANHHPYPVEHHDWEGGGHAILFPYVPTTHLTYAHPVSRRLSTSGGTPAINALVNEQSWAAVQAFLARATAAHAARAR